jgi:dihydroorotase
LSANPLLVRGGTVVGPNGRAADDLLLENGRIMRRGKGLRSSKARVIDASEMLILPGLVDMHAHLREPGGEHSETVETGCRAAAAGGYTAVVAMPNTEPPIDAPELVRSVRSAASAVGYCDVEVAACVSRGRRGLQPSEMALMASHGVRIFTDDGACVRSASVLKLALVNSAAFGFVVADHPEDPSLVGEDQFSTGDANGPSDDPGTGRSVPGCMNLSELSERLGLPGRPKEAEETIVARDLAILEATGGRLHLQHLTTKESVDLVRRAKDRGLSVTAEVTPHHLVFTEESLNEYDPLYKVNPPLRTAGDVEGLRDAILERVIDVIATDHAPHAPELKDRPLEEAPAGIAGLEVAFPFLYTELVCQGVLPLEDLVRLMSWRPAEILGLDDHGRPLDEGATANLFAFDPSPVWEFDPFVGQSKAKATPYAGRKFNGKVVHTVYRGKLVVEEGAVI